jgi:hypothetical protein
MMKWLWIVIAGLLASTAGADTRHYDIKIRHLNTAEEQLLYEHKRTIGLKQFEIERQLKEVRRQRLELERLRTEASRTRATAYAEQTRTRRSTPRKAPVRYVAPQPDWKTVETPDVVVKGTFREGDRMAALVSGGKTVHTDEVFSTRYRGKLKYWKVLEITQHDAYFQQVERDGSPLRPPEPVVVEDPKPPSFIHRVWALMR